jgi:1,4-alpha-glucan branching enzyme
MDSVRNAVCHRYNFSAFERVIYSESHDEVANGKQRVPSEIDPADPHSWYAEKRSTLAAALTMTSPGIPMLFQGQEFMRNGWFDDSKGIDWSEEDECRGIVRLYRDLIRLRLNRQGISAGLTGQRVEFHHLNDRDKLVAYRRWRDGGPEDDVVVVANFSNKQWDDYRIGFVRGGSWILRLNSDAKVYSDNFGDFSSADLTPTPDPYDGLPFSASLAVAPYSVLIYSEKTGDDR